MRNGTNNLQMNTPLLNWHESKYARLYNKKQGGLMCGEEKIKQEIQQEKITQNDTVIFMTAYDIHKIERHRFRFGKKPKKRELWAQFHIAGFSYNNTYITPYAKCRYTAEYNSLNQVTAFNFEKEFEEYNKIYSDFADEMMTALYLQHSAKALLDSTLLQINTCFNMERFLVVFGDDVYQVDPAAFIMSGSLIVNFELIDFKNGLPIDSKSTHERSHNFGIKSIDKIKCFNEDDFFEDHRKISDIIFENIYGFLTKSSNNKWEVGNYSYVYNTLVLSEKIENVTDYFQCVLGGKIEDFAVKNISATDAFNFYSTEYLGVVTNISNGKDKHRILNDYMVLEGFKIFVLLKMIIDYETHHKLDEIIDH